MMFLLLLALGHPQKPFRLGTRMARWLGWHNPSPSMVHFAMFEVSMLHKRAIVQLGVLRGSLSSPLHLVVPWRSPDFPSIVFCATLALHGAF